MGTNPILERSDEIITEAFEMFAVLHPFEAFDMDKTRFCDYMRKRGFSLTDDEITALIEQTR